ERVPALVEQLTPVLLVLLTSAESCSFPPAITDGSAGEICTVVHLTQGTTCSAYERFTGPLTSPLTASTEIIEIVEIVEIVNAKSPACVGVPEMAPVSAFNAKPGGNLP